MFSLEQKVPEGIVFFSGDHGVGKTYTATAMLDYFYARIIYCGPIIRNTFAESGFTSFGGWVKNMEQKLGQRWDDELLLTAIKNYIAWYYGIVESFHRYYIFNGDRKIFKNRYSMGMPKQICENFADLLCNEKTKISISNESSSRKLGEILDKNHFYLKANQAIEKSFALGFGAFVLSADSKFGIRIQMNYDSKFDKARSN